MTRSRNLLAPALGPALALLALTQSGCAHKLAEMAVRAPNLEGTSPAAQRWLISSQQLTQFNVTRPMLRIPVGPPDATIAAWVMDPFEGAVEVTPRSISIKRVVVSATTTTQPATKRAAPTTAPITPRGTVFLLHGIADRIHLAPYVLWASVLATEGYRVILIDLRGHGESTGRWISYGVHESHDLVQVLDELERRHLVAGRVAVFGVSYGAAVAIQWAAIDSRVVTVIALEPFSSLREAVDDFTPLVLGWWQNFISPRRIRAAIKEAGRLGNFDPDAASPEIAIRKMSQPVLLIHGADDTALPPYHSLRLAAAAPDRTRIIIVPGADHLTLWIYGFDQIRRETINWLQRYVAS
jgi:pimeloyl-ACP methyl ester carboxylesterase